MNNWNVNGYRSVNVVVLNLHGNMRGENNSEIYNVIRFLVEMSGSKISLKSLIRGAGKLSKHMRNLFGKRPDAKADRRKSKTNPNVVCGFPISQNAREEAPFF